MIRRERAILLKRAQMALKSRSFSADTVCFGPQRRAVESTAKRAIWKCGRRAGKTVGAAFWLLDLARTSPRGLGHLYLTLTRINAEEIIWPTLCELNEQYSLGGIVRQGKLTIEFPGRGTVRLTGCDNDRERGKVRGKKFGAVVIDEPQNIPDRILRPLLTQDLRATLLDHGAPMRLVGTPSYVRSGYWWECYAGPRSEQWEQHAWTLLDNPMLPIVAAGGSAEDALREVREEEGWTVDSPAYQREYLGMDVEDLDSLLFEVGSQALYAADSVEGPWTTVVGVDIGHDDASAIVVLGWRKHERVVYQLSEWAERGCDVVDLAERVEATIEQWNPEAVVADTGGLGKMIAVTIQRRFGLPIIAADKGRKAEHIRLMNTALRRGELKIIEGGLCHEDSRLVRKDSEGLARGLLQELPAAKGGYHSDVCFVAGTMISTPSGDVPIESLSAGDLVTTRQGPRRVRKAWCSGERKVVRAEIGSHVLTGTPDHPVYTERGWVHLESLLRSDVFVTLEPCHNSAHSINAGAATTPEAGARGTTPSNTKGARSRLWLSGALMVLQKPWNGAARFGVAGQMPPITQLGGISPARASTFTAPSGRPSEGRSPEATTSTTSTATGQTIGSKTSSASAQRITSGITLALPRRWRELVSTCLGLCMRLPANGTEAKQDAPGTASTASGCGKADRKPRSSANNAERPSCPEAKKRSFAAVRVSPAGTAPVYELSVSDAHEYFANGILVHNCDALLYGWREARGWLEEPAPEPVDVDKEDPDEVYRLRRLERRAAVEDALGLGGDVAPDDDGDSGVDSWL